MIKMNITVDLDSFTKGMTELQETQVPFATKNALNAVAKDVQAGQRAHLREVFHLRREQWADRSIKITHFATKQEQYATMAVSSPDDRSDILGKFEDQTQKTALGSHGIAVPFFSSDRSAPIADTIQRGAKRPRAYDLQEENGRVVGRDGTFIVVLPDGRRLLLQRKDLGKRAQKAQGRVTQERATLLYLFTPHVKVTPDLHFYDIAAKAVSEQWDTRFIEAFVTAMQSAR